MIGDGIDSSMNALASNVSCKCLNVRFNLSCLHLDVAHDDFEEFDLSPEKLKQHEPETQTAVDYLANAMDGVSITSLLVEPKVVKRENITSIHYGAQITFPAVVITKQLHDWKLFTCYNCKTTTHAVSLQDKRNVLVNFGEMLQDSQQQSIISDDPNYCKVFEVVAMPIKGQVEKSSANDSAVADDIRNVSERAVRFLEDEKSRMRRRIQEYENLQLAMYQDMERAISIGKLNLENQIWAAYNDTHDDDDVDSAFERSVEETSDVGSRSQSVNSSGKNGRSSSVADDMFEVDVFGENYNALDDDDGLVDDDDLFADDDDDADAPNYQSRTNGMAVLGDNLAKSVPIPIMRQMRMSTTGASYSDSDDDTTPNPQDMQASMRALAQSVGVDGTEMFGDLPKPRCNTFSRRSTHDY